MNNRLNLKMKKVFQKCISFFMALLLILEVSYPTQVWALTGGPSQPEVQSFEPIATSDMVNLFTGDFSYNIPLLDVEGYPINIAYHSGITMDEEASWVGLGWNINPGVINRSMRGLPDDFSGDEVTKITHMKPNKTWGLSANASASSEILGVPIGVSGSLSGTISINNYTGPSISKGFSLGVNIRKGVGGADASLGINSSSSDGLTVIPSIGIGGYVGKSNEKHSQSYGLKASSSLTFNSRQGLKNYGIDLSVKADTKGLNKKNEKKTGSAQKGVNASYNLMSPTYTPNINHSMQNYAFYGSISAGGAAQGAYLAGGLTGFFTRQKVLKEEVSSPAFGYLNIQNGQNNYDALLDFNREKDGVFKLQTPNLPVPNLTYDLYTVVGQGISASYRPFRNDIGHVFDNFTRVKTWEDKLTLEAGVGAYAHGGWSVMEMDVFNRSGKWDDDNGALKLAFTRPYNANENENVYFREANDQMPDLDPSFYNSMGMDKPVRYDANFSGATHYLNQAFVDNKNRKIPFKDNITRKKRQKKSQLMNYLTINEYSDFAVDQSYFSSISGKPSHHIGEITSLNADGMRYVYGLPAYNNIQKEVTFSVGSNNNTNHSNISALINAAKGLVVASPTDNSTNNKNGIDNLYTSTNLPPYAHSYLLTTILSPDYVDADKINGPSDNDLGSYTKFEYEKISDYKWRIPMELNHANYNEGLKANYEDDKGNIIYGEKDIYFLKKITTKNYVAIFELDNTRPDGLGVIDENGGANPNIKSRSLKSITLYSKKDLSNPLKKVHFDYTYDLCKGIKNTTNQGNGKLTLKKIYFSYQNSNQARLSPYVFDYHESNSSENPNYDMSAHDRWGNYKENLVSTIGLPNAFINPNDYSGAMSAYLLDENLPNSEFPYVDQEGTNAKAKADMSAAVWTLKSIKLPTGGTIDMTYESDDYQYIQDKVAGQMFKIIGYKDPDDNHIQMFPIDKNVDFTDHGGKFYFRLDPNFPSIDDYLRGIDNLYFRFLIDMKKGGLIGKTRLEYVSGYGIIDNYDAEPQNGLGWVQFKSVELRPGGLALDKVNPVLMAGLNFAKLYHSDLVYDRTNGTLDDGFGKKVIAAILNSGFLRNIKDALVNGIAGLNYNLVRNKKVANEFILNKSWIRLNNVNGHKLGGGIRVKKIEMNDHWQDLTANPLDQNKTYGQEYSYNLHNGRSSGVASYEPIMGGDENPFHKPIFIKEENLRIPDEESYVEEPIGESHFPSASVGYSLVTVKNLSHTAEGVNKHATGRIENEFYTAKDFPTIVERTELYSKRYNPYKDKFDIKSLFKYRSKDYLAATQGFLIENNDMHGKPRSVRVYQENLSSVPIPEQKPISMQKYVYKTNGGNRLVNTCTVMNSKGNIEEKEIGVTYEMVSDLRESKTSVKIFQGDANVDVLVGPNAAPIPIPTFFPSAPEEETRFRSAALTKTIHRFGILDSVIVQDLGSVITSRNLAFDVNTGNVLLTETTTNYDDRSYTFNYPAWWYYNQMGPANDNINYSVNNLLISIGTATVSGSPANFNTSYFIPGDEVMLRRSTSSLKAWVKSVDNISVTFMDHLGNTTPIDGSFNVKVIRSGNRNHLNTNMATTVSLSNPLDRIGSNNFYKVLNASATEFNTERKTACNCVATDNVLKLTNNPYVNGTAGNWYPNKSYGYITQRNQSNINKNTNIREDGVFSSFAPFYQFNGNGWEIVKASWLNASEVSIMNVHGIELENKDALGRYSSASYGYNQSQPLSVAVNAKLSEQAFDGFEDYAYNPCVDDHFKVSGGANNLSSESHSGKYSLKVGGGAAGSTYLSITKQLGIYCNTNNNCNVKLTKTATGTLNEFTITSSNGTAPYYITHTLLSGLANAPIISPLANGIKVKTNGTCKIQVKTIDANKCVYYETFNF
jgi:hypothetical protein